MPERAVLEIVADVNKALAEFQRFERQWKQAVARLDAAADTVEFDKAGRSLDQLRTDARQAFTGMQTSARKAGREIQQLAGHSKTTSKAQRELNAEVKKLGARLREAEKGLQRFEKSGRGLDRTRSKVAGLSSQVRQLAGLFGGLSVAFAGRALFQQLNTFSLRIAGVAAVSRATQDELRELTAEAIRLGETTQKSSSEVASAQENLARAGFKVNEILAATPGLLNLSIAGQLGLAEATSIAADTLRTFNLEAEETGRVADVLAKTASSANTTVAELSEGLKFVGPIAASAGRTMEETASALAVLADRGLKATLGGTGLRIALLNLASGAPKVQKALQGLGLTLADVDPKTKSLVEIFEALNATTLDLTSAAQIAGARGGGALLVLAGAAPQLRKLTEEINAAGGAAADMARVFEGSLFGATKRVSSAFDGLVQKTGDRGLSKILRNLLDLLAGVIRRGDELGDVLIGIVSGSVVPLSLALEALVGTISAVVLGFSRLQKLAGLDEAAKQTESFAREIAGAREVVTEFRRNLISDVEQAGVAVAELFTGTADQVAKLRDSIDDQLEELEQFRDGIGDAADATTEASREIVRRVARIEEAINSLPPAQRAAYEQTADALAKLREAYRKTAQASGELTEEQLLDAARLAEATDKIVQEVGGGLDLQVRAIREAVEELRIQGELTAETQARFAQKIEATAKQFAALKIPESAELRALRVEFGVAAVEVEKAGAAAEAAAPKVASLDSSFRGLAGGLDRLREAQEGVRDQARATGELVDRLEALRAQISRTNEENEELARLEREVFFGTSALATKRQELATIEGQVATGAEQATRAIEAMLDPLNSSGQLSQAAALRLLEQRDAQADSNRELYRGEEGHRLLNAALGRYIESQQPAAETGKAAAVVLETLADGTRVLRTETEGAAIQIRKGAEGFIVFNKAAADAKFGELAVEVGRTGDGMLTLSNVAPDAAAGVEDLGTASDDAVAALEGVAGGAEAAAEGVEELGERAGRAAPELDQTAAAAEDLARGLEAVGERSRRSAEATAAAWREVRDVLGQVKQEAGGIAAALERIAEISGSAGGGAPPPPTGPTP